MNGITDTLRKNIDKAVANENDWYAKSSADRAALAEWQKPAEYKNPYATISQKVLDDYLNKSDFNYNLSSDKLYSQYADMYKKQGERAMRDTIARASELTGGYGSSYGTVAGEQAYQNSLDKLNEIVPTLYDKAYAKYKDEKAAQKNILDILMDMDDKEYEKYRDKVKDYEADRDYYNKKYQYAQNNSNAKNKSLMDIVMKLASLENADYYKYLNSIK